MQKILVTGAAGFIGYHLVQALCAAGHEVLGTDNLNPYYDVTLKQARLEQVRHHKTFTFHQASLEDAPAMADIFARFKPDIVVHLAAQAGVRYSIDHPRTYVTSNLDGFLNVLEGCRHHGVRHLVFASSSSVYGANRKQPFSEGDRVDHPVSLYAATKKANELMAYTYAHLYGFPATGLRFFTVYGPWGRPDMAYFKFTQKIMAGEPIAVFNHGDMKRDFTYIDDIIEGVVRVMAQCPHTDANNAAYALYNIGNNHPEQLMDMIHMLEEALGKKAILDLQPMQPGDVYETYADILALEEAVGFKPSTSLKTGLGRFVKWYRDYYFA